VEEKKRRKEVEKRSFIFTMHGVDVEVELKRAEGRWWKWELGFL